MQYLVHLTLVSDEIVEDIPAEWLESWDSPTDFMDNHYFSSGGSCVRLNPESEIDFEDSAFSATPLDGYDEENTVEEYGDGFQVISCEEQPNGNFDLTYRMRPQIELTVEAESEEEAKKICNEQVYEVFDIIDVAADEVLGTEFIEIESVRKA